MYFDGSRSRDRGRYRRPLSGRAQVKCPFCGRTTVVTKRNYLFPHGGKSLSCPGSYFNASAV